MKPTFSDCILIGALLLGGLAGWCAVSSLAGTGAGLVIEAAGTPPREIPLAGPARTITVEGPRGTTVVELSGNRARIASSPCPRHLCREGGWIARPGETLVCVPNRVVVRITGPESADVHAVTQ